MKCYACGKSMTTKDGSSLAAMRLSVLDAASLFPYDFLREQLGKYFQTKEIPFKGDFCYECILDALMLPQKRKVEFN